MSKITVTTIAGQTSGSDANTVKIESGDSFNVVSGATTLGGTASITSNATVGGTLGVTGASTLTGALSAKGGAVFNEDSADVDFRVEGNGNTHLIHADAGSDRVGINTGATDLSAGNYAALNVGGVVSNAGSQAIFCTGNKTSYASASYKLQQGGLGIGDSTTQASGTGGVITLTGRTTDGDNNQVHAATIEAHKTNGTSGNYGFYMKGRTRENGNATMQTGFVFGYDRVQFFTNNAHRFNIDATGNLTVSGIVTSSELNTGPNGIGIGVSTITGPAEIVIDPAAVGDNTGKVLIKGDLQVDGTETIVNSTTVTVEDKNVVLGSGASNDAAANGGGITLESGQGNKTIRWLDSTDSWTFSEHVDLAATKSYKINGVDVLSSTTLGAGVTQSSLTSVGTLQSLNPAGLRGCLAGWVGGWLAPRCYENYGTTSRTH